MTKSYFPVLRTLSTSSGVVISPHSEAYKSAGTLFLTAISYHLLPNAPTEKIAAFFAVQLLTAASIRPLPDEVESKIVSEVFHNRRILSEMRSCNTEASLLRCPIIGVVIFSRTSGCTVTGPGINNFIINLSFLNKFILIFVLSIQISVIKTIVLMNRNQAPLCDK